jgi:hypothetical protein
VFPSEQATPDFVDLYHGTPRASGEAMLREGARPVDARAEVASVADEYGVSFDALWSRMGHVWGKGREGDPRVYLSSNREHAARYARRGSEVAYFALRAVYALRESVHPETRPTDIWAKGEAARRHEPVVIHAQVPWSALPERSAKTLIEIRALPRRIVATWCEEVVLPELPVEWIVELILVAPCTCWQDGRPCPACRASETALSGGLE